MQVDTAVAPGPYDDFPLTRLSDVSEDHAVTAALGVSR